MKELPARKTWSHAGLNPSGGQPFCSDPFAATSVLKSEQDFGMECLQHKGLQPVPKDKRTLSGFWG